MRLHKIIQKGINVKIKNFVKECKSIENEDIIIIDIGARTGLEDVLKTLESITPLKVIGFEPEPEEFERLKKTNHLI